MRKTRKICFVQTSRTYYGAERSLATIARYLAGRGWEVKVISLAPGEAHKAFAAEGLDAVCYPATRVRDVLDYWTATRRLAALFRDWKPDVAAANMVKAYLYMAPATSGTRIKRCLFTRGFAGKGPNIGSVFEYFTYLIPPDILIANSRAALASYAPRRYLRAGRADFVYPACEPPVPRPGGPPRTEPYFISVGRLHPEKGFNVFIRAAAAIAGSSADTRFLVVGGRDETVPGYAEKLKQIAAGTDLDGRLIFPGYSRDVATELKHAVAYVNAHPEPGEPFGKVIVEAMRLGVPVIATDCGGPRELVVDGETGFLVRPGDPAALAAKMKELLEDPALAKHMGGAGRQRAETEFAPAKSLAKLEELLGSLITEGKR